MGFGGAPSPTRQGPAVLLPMAPQSLGLTTVSRAYLTGGPLPQRARAEPRVEAAGKEAGRRSSPGKPHHEIPRPYWLTSLGSLGGLGGLGTRVEREAPPPSP